VATWLFSGQAERDSYLPGVGHELPGIELPISDVRHPDQPELLFVIRKTQVGAGGGAEHGDPSAVGVEPFRVNDVVRELRHVSGPGASCPTTGGSSKTTMVAEYGPRSADRMISIRMKAIRSGRA